MSNKIWFACLKQLQHYWSVWAAAKPRLPFPPPLSNFIQNVNIPFSLPSDSSAEPLSQHLVLLSFWRVKVGLTTWLWTGLHPSALPCGTRQRHSVTKKPGTCQEFRQPITLFVVLYFCFVVCLEPNYPIARKKFLRTTKLNSSFWTF